jgi:acetyl esterase/lipase
MRSVLLEKALWAVRLKESQESPSPEFKHRDYSKSIVSPEPPEHLHRKLNISVQRIDGRNILYLSPKTNPQEPDRRKYILFLHGGSYVLGFTRQHWGFLARLAERTGSTVIAPDYPLAPRYYYVDAYKMLLSLYKQATVEIDPENLIVMGDSAGGGLALGLSQVLVSQNLPQPSKIVLLSPWLDVTMGNPYIKEIDPLDPFLSVRALKEAGASWARGANPRKPVISPIYGSMVGLAPISLFIGTNDILIADCRKLRGVARADGVTIDYYEYEGMFHDWMLLNFPEARQAFKQIVDIVSAAGMERLNEFA